MYTKISNKFKFNHRDNYYFYESVFSENAKTIILDDILGDYEVIEFVLEINSPKLFDGTPIYLSLSRKEIIKKLKMIKSKKVFFVNLPSDFFKYVNNKKFVIYSTEFPTDETLMLLKFPLLLTGRNFSNEKQSDFNNTTFYIFKNKVLSLLDKITATILVSAFIIFFYMYRSDFIQYIQPLSFS